MQEGNTPVIIARKNKHMEIVEFLSGGDENDDDVGAECDDEEDDEKDTGATEEKVCS